VRRPIISTAKNESGKQEPRKLNLEKKAPW